MVSCPCLQRKLEAHFYAGGSFSKLASQVDKLQNITMCDGEGDAPEMAGTTGLKKQEPVQLGLECKLSTGGGRGDVQIGRGNIGYPLSVISSKKRPLEIC